jgi:hypothetical protein
MSAESPGELKSKGSADIDSEAADDYLKIDRTEPLGW